jgi:dUTP pyrophosphatase
LSAYLKQRGFEKISKEQWLSDGGIDGAYDKIILPKRATQYSAGHDIFSPINFILPPNEEIKIPCGFKVYMLRDEFFEIVPRSGLGFKYYTRLANTVGVVDSDFFNNKDNEGHCFIKLRNEGDKDLEIHVGDAIAQGIFQKYLIADNDESDRVRSGGFGSTG